MSQDTEKWQVLLLSVNCNAKVGGIVANQSTLADFMYDNMILEMNDIHAAWQNGCKKLGLLGSSCIYPHMAPCPFPKATCLPASWKRLMRPMPCQRLAVLNIANF